MTARSRKQDSGFDPAAWPVLLLALALLAFCVAVSSGKLMWMDEVLTWYPANLPSLTKLLDFTTDKINAGHYLYFFAVWIWGKIFSTSELSLRLFSSVSLAAAMGLTWLTLRRINGAWPATLATVAVFVSAPLVLYYNSQARFYGTLLFATALLLYVTQRIWNVRAFDWKAGLALFLVNGSLPLIHLFGFVYGGLILLVVFARDLTTGRFRLWYYLCSAAGWLLFLPFVPALRRQMELSEPHFWIPEATLSDLRQVYAQHAWHWQAAVLLLGAALIVRILGASAAPAPAPKPWDKWWVVMGLALFALPVLLWLASEIGRPMFLARYVIVFYLGWAILLSAAFALVLPAGKALTARGQLALGLAACVLIAALGFRAWQLYGREMKIPAPELPAMAARLPVVTDDTHFFLQALYYHPDVEDFYFVLDWESALASDVRNDTQDFQAMQALRRHVESGRILDARDVLERFPAFILYRSRHWRNFLAKQDGVELERIGRRAYIVRPLGAETGAE